jgi:hypothetical protein
MTMPESTLAPAGSLNFNVIRGGRTVDGAHDAMPWPVADNWRTIAQHGFAQKGLPDEVNEWRRSNVPHLMRGYRRIVAARLLGVPTHYGALWCQVRRGNGEVINLGLASLRVVTTAGVNKIVAALNTSDASTATTFKYHGYGTGSTAEASGDTALVTELTTEYAVNSTRPTGTQTTGGSSNVYRSVATLTPDSGGTIALREHGIFSASSAGTLLDRTLFSAINLDSTAGDSLQTTYELTFAAGG